MVLSICCTFCRGAMWFELIPGLGNAAHDLSFSWRISPCIAVLWGAPMAGSFRKRSLLYTGCFGWSVCNAFDWAAHPGYRHSDAGWGSTVGLCCFFKPDSNSTRSPDLTFFQPKRKCSAYPMAAADHCDSNRKYCCLLCSTVSCCGWVFPRLYGRSYGCASPYKHPDRVLCGSSPGKWTGKIQS